MRAITEEQAMKIPSLKLVEAEERWTVGAHSSSVRRS